MSKSVLFSELSDLINSLGNQTISLTPKDEYDVGGRRHWAVHQAYVFAGAVQFAYEILYVNSECSSDSLERAKGYCRQHPSATRQIVYAGSLTGRLQIGRLVNAGGAPAQSVKDFLLLSFRVQLERYREQIKQIQARYFIQPSWTIEDHGSTEGPIEYLKLAGKSRGADGALGVITGDPGQGKTYFTWKLIELALRADVLPIFVDSEQWRQLAPDDFENLSAVIVHSFRSYGVAFDVPPDKAQRFLDVFLKAGVFTVIFDGFDEYVLRNHTRTSGVEAIVALRELCESTHAPILITSRTTFWDDLVQVFENAEYGSVNCVRWSLAPFEAQHASVYFDSRFPKNPALSEQALGLFRAMKKASASYGAADLVGRGFFLPLIHDLVDQSKDSTDVLSYLEEMAPTHWIVDNLCKREVIRQAIVRSDVQIELLKRVAIDQFAGRATTSAHLAAHLHELGVTRPVVDQMVGADTDPKERGKLRDHPLLSLEPAKRTWTVPHSSVLHYLLGDFLIEHLQKLDLSKVEVFLSETKLRDDPVATQDILQGVLDLFHERHNERKLERIKDVVTAALGACSKTAERSEGIRWLCTTLCTTTIDFIYKDASHERRGAELASIFPFENFAGAVFSGQLAKYSFANTLFSHSIFDNVLWSSCRFANDTYFTDCEFVGGQVVSSVGFGSAVFSTDCRIDHEAYICIARESLYADGRKYSEKDLAQDLGRLLRRLLPADAQRPRVKESTLFSGTIGLSQVAGAAKTVVEKYLADELSAELRPGTYRLKASAELAVNFYRSNGVFTGVVRESFDELKVICLRSKK